jgi:UDP-N-acetylmuramoyl-tripeptide--D-alanyl-D-alanine ligase
MISFSLSQAADLLGGRLLGADATFGSVSTDSRTVGKGDLFVALRGPRFDGHDYLPQVVAVGAVGALVERYLPADLPLVQVQESCVALGQLAAAWRSRVSAPVVAVTGSNGKTTVKEMIASILRRQGSVLATAGNLNNHIGLPLTLLELQEQEYAVVELGASAPGEIGYLSRIAQPDVAVLNNAGRAHLEGFGTLEGVAHAKAEIVEGLKQDGVFVINGDDPWAGLWRELAGERRLISFGLEKKADVFSPEGEEENGWDSQGFFSRFPVETPQGSIEIRLGLTGRHNRANALAAIAAAQQLGISSDDIRQGLAELRPVAGRLQPLSGRGGVQLIDDSYNANPDSVGAAIGVLATAPGRRFLVLGELAELGDDGDRFYRTLGEHAQAAGIEHLYGVGPAGKAAEAFGRGGRVFENRERLIDALYRDLESGDRVLIKGSRRAGMEQVIRALAAGEDN